MVRNDSENVAGRLNDCAGGARNEGAPRGDVGAFLALVVAARIHWPEPEEPEVLAYRGVIEGGERSQFVRDHLVLYRWPPQLIAAKPRDMHPDDSSQRVSHETVFASIYAHPRGGLKKERVEALRQSKPKRGLRRTTAAKRTWVPEQLRIVHRPETARRHPLHGRSQTGAGSSQGR